MRALLDMQKPLAGLIRNFAPALFLLSAATMPGWIASSTEISAEQWLAKVAVSSPATR